MKRIMWVINVALIVLYASTNVRAGSLTEYGLVVGIHHTFPVALSEGITSDSRLGVSGGLYGQIGLGDVIALEGECYFEQRDMTVTEDQIQIDLTTQTLNFPVLLRIGLPLGFMIEAGPQYSMILAGSSDITSDAMGYIDGGLLWKPALGLTFGLRYLYPVTEIETTGASDFSQSVLRGYVGFEL